MPYDPLQDYRMQNGMATPPIDIQRAGMGMPVNAMQPQQQMAAPQQSPAINEILTELTKSIQNKQDNSGLIQQIMAARMQPNMQDVQQTSYMRAMNPTQAITPDQVMAERFKSQLTPYATAATIAKQEQENRFAPYTALAGLMNANTAATGGATGAFINSLAQDPRFGGDIIAATQYAKGGANQGTMMNNGVMAPLPGNLSTIHSQSAATASGKVEGSGDITDVQKRAQGQLNVANTASTLESLYDQLEQAGAAVSTKQGSLQNLSARTRSGGVGQAVGRAFGTKEQSIRNQIGMQIPNLINDIRSATGMSAKAMDSNAELQFYLKMATDPNADIEANRAALTTIRQKYLVGGQAPAAPTAPGVDNVPTFSGPNDPGFQSLPPGASFKTQDGRTMVKH